MRNKFELKVAKSLSPGFEYEARRLPYTITHTYLPDFINEATKEIIEAKGLFTAEDRRKHVALKQQQPDWKITIVFQNPDKPINKGSSTSYGAWCTKHGIDWRKA